MLQQLAHAANLLAQVHILNILVLNFSLDSPELLLKLLVYVLIINRHALQILVFDFALLSAQARGFAILEQAVLLLGQILAHRNELGLGHLIDVDFEAPDVDPLVVLFNAVCGLSLRLRHVDDAGGQFADHALIRLVHCVGLALATSLDRSVDSGAALLLIHGVLRGDDLAPHLQWLERLLWNAEHALVLVKPLTFNHLVAWV